MLYRAVFVYLASKCWSMEKLYRFLSVITALSAVMIFSQRSAAQSAVSKVINFSMDEVTGIFMPPELYVDIDFIDDNGNKILEAKESGHILLKLQNYGGDASGVEVFVTPYKDVQGLFCETKSVTADIFANSRKELDFPIYADISIPTDSVFFDIKVRERMGYDIDAKLLLSTCEYQKAAISLQGVSIVDSGRGARARNGNPDGKVQTGEVVWAKLLLQNTGMGEARSVSYTINSEDPNILLMTDTGLASEINGTLNDLLVGQTAEVSFRLSPNNSYVQKGKYLPVKISLTEESGFGNLASAQIPISLDKVPDVPKIVDIKGDRAGLLAMQQTRVYSQSNRITSNIRDISQAPVGLPLYEDAVAIVIGAEKNSYGVAPAPYAARDAQLMAKYLTTSMGVNDVKVLVNEKVTGAALSDCFDSRYGYLKQVVIPGKTDVFVFYSGHGIPDYDPEGKPDVFLFPYDARKELISDRGYSVNRLYADLNSLGAKSVTVILDACFSGSSRQTASLAAENISGTKGVRISNQFISQRPWEINPEFRLFTSSTGEQTSLGYDQSQSGLFTYFLTIGLQGDADEDDNGSITMDELVKFVTKNVSSEAAKIRGGAQTPEFFGNGEMIIERIR